jgi:hypothetical protein
MCTTNVKVDIYYANICKNEHEKNLKGYGAKSCLKLMLNKLKEMKDFGVLYRSLK